MNNYEPYHSPLKLLAQFGIDPERISSETIRIKRKELLLELQLDSKQMLTIDGVKYTKNDVLNTFEELENQDDFDFHLKVTRCKELSNFLNFHTLPAEKLDPNLELPFHTTNDQQKLSRFLAYAISKVMGKVIRNAGYQKLLNLGPILDLLRHIDYEFAFRKLITFNNDLHISTVLPHVEGSKFEWDEFKHLDCRELYVLANYVDQGLVNFAQKLTISIVNFTVKYQRYPGRKNHLVILCEHALILNSLESTKAILKNNLRILRKNVEKKEIVPSSTIVPRVAAVLAMTTFVIICGLFTFYPIHQRAQAEIQQRNLQTNQTTDTNSLDFDLDDFHAFHKKIENDLIQGAYVKSQGTTYPSFNSILVDTAEISTGLGTIINRTKYDLLIVALTKNGLKGFHVEPSENQKDAISVNDEFLIYSGLDWNSNFGLEYAHFSNAENRTYWLTFEGHFNEFNYSNLTLFKKRFKVPFAGTTTIKEENETITVQFKE